MGEMARQSCKAMIWSCSAVEEREERAAKPSGSRKPVRKVRIGDSVMTIVPMSILRVATNPIPFCSILVIMYEGEGNGPPGDNFEEGVIEMVDAEMLFVASIDAQIMSCGDQHRRRSRLLHRRRRYMVARWC